MENVKCTVGGGRYSLPAKIVTENPCYLGEYELESYFPLPRHVQKHSEVLQLANTVRIIDGPKVKPSKYHECLKRGTDPGILETANFVHRFMHMEALFVRGVDVMATPSQVVLVAEQLAGLWKYLSVNGKMEGDNLLYYLFCGAKIMDDYWYDSTMVTRSFIYGRNGPTPDLDTEVGSVAYSLLTRDMTD